MRHVTIFLAALTLTACGPSQQEIDDTATITCNIMAESRNMDAAFRIKEINAAREKIGAGPYLGDDQEIRDSFEMGLCKELVKGDGSYEVGLLKWQQKLEAERLAQKKARDAEIARQAKLDAEREEQKARARAEAVAKYGESGAAGIKKYAGCVACHGPTGAGGIGPQLAGRDASYITKRLKAYKNNETVGAQSALMWGQAAMLSDEDMRDLANYISSFK